MFGKSPREPQKPTMSDLKDIKLSPPTMPANVPSAIDLNTQDTRLQTEIVADKELVSTVERISRIVSPYFIAIVGLALYERNFLLGTIFILIGILSLLKVTTNDVANFLEWLKNFLGLK
ncbi:MAG: hypothetical protein AAFQ41_05975 [Cyanobacteria bacterium J06623_7]